MPGWGLLMNEFLSNFLNENKAILENIGIFGGRFLPVPDINSYV